MAYFFTADLHLGHENIIKYCNRPFKSIEEMDETLINNINGVAKAGDYLYVVGDFAFRSKVSLYIYVENINPRIILIPGSHDTLADTITYVNPIHEGYFNLLDEYENQRLIVLCHYSMRSWNKSHYCSYHLFGHHHGNLNPYGLSFDVGVDTNNFYPYSLQDIENKMKTLKPIIDLRKKEN